MTGQVDWYSSPNMVQFFDPKSDRLLMSSNSVSDWQCQWFVEHVVTTTTWHHAAANPVPLATWYASLSKVDWTSDIPVMVMVIITRTQSIKVTLDERIAQEREAITKPTIFEVYIETLLDHIWWLLYIIKFAQGGEWVLCKCLWNNKHIKVAMDGCHWPGMAFSFLLMLLTQSRKEICSSCDVKAKDYDWDSAPGLDLQNVYKPPILHQS